jgi:hypothetical protein
MRAVLLFGLLSHPLPVTTISGVVNADGSVTVSWTLPADPSVVGVTIYRDDLEGGTDVIFELVGLSTSFTDASAPVHHSLRYWVHTRNALGELSTGAFVEVIDADGIDGDDHVDVECHGSALPAPRAWPFVLAAALAAAALLAGRRM